MLAVDFLFHRRGVLVGHQHIFSFKFHELVTFGELQAGEGAVVGYGAIHRRIGGGIGCGRSRLAHVGHRSLHGVGTRGGISRDLGRRGGFRSVHNIDRLTRRNRSIGGNGLARSGFHVIARSRLPRFGLGCFARSLLRGRLLVFLDLLQSTIGDLRGNAHGARGRPDRVRLARTLRLFSRDFVLVVATVVLEVLVHEHLELV